MTKPKISSRTLWIVITLLLVLIAFAAWAFSSRQNATTHSAKTSSKHLTQSIDHVGKSPQPGDQNYSGASATALPAASTSPAQIAATVPVVNLSRALPGLGNDAENYASTLESSTLGQNFRNTLQEKEKTIHNALRSGSIAHATALQDQYQIWKQNQRSDALSKADQAYSAGDWSSAVTDYQQRIALGDNADPQIWWHLANALQKRAKISAKETKDAAYLAYNRNIYSQKPDVTLLLPTLQLLRKALAAESDHFGEIHLLEAMYRAYPDNAQVEQMGGKCIRTIGQAQAYFALTMRAVACP